ncbi:Uncharacterized protein predicted to be involved in DNA repair [Haemophilus parainfluenzae]|uniref:Uncharacterized protein predicted to be involved in DNA repair n=2 Tax=Haemophilus parainfluenzae TaxID=729 RepID=A0A3S4VJK8_HAEPA|nr:type I-C CRISPR-associated protein Cas7/Csd2 [Haemophilus parainfluenzae]VEI29190.1 Uncharacterized protein predicted to be involved in DNA repair [Haemophilus parainfluenzae]
MFAKLSYYAHSAQDELGNLLPYEHWQTLQSHSVNVGEMAAVHWKPAIRWVIDRIYVLKPIRFESVRRNELGGKISAGKVSGAMKRKSIDPIVPLEVSITRMAVTNEKDLEKERTMGRKYIVPYALYRVHGFISANLAAKTGFSDDDLAKLWQALTLMFEHDRSAARGEMAARKLIVFKHDSALGSQPAHKLFDAVKVERVNGESGTPASGFGDYNISVVSDGLNGVSVEEYL